MMDPKKSNKTEARDGDSSETPTSSDSGRESQKRSLSSPTNEEVMNHKKFRPLNKQLCRESTDEDDIKVLKSDYTRSLDEEKSRKDPEQVEDTTEQSVQADRDTDVSDQNSLTAELKMLQEQNIKKEKHIWSLSKDLSLASQEVADSRKSLESKNHQIRALEDKVDSFEEEMEELHEKQEKIIDCMYIEKQLIEKRLMNASKLIEENKLEGKKTDILNLNVSLEGKEETIQNLKGENEELQKQLARKVVEMEKKDVVAKKLAGQVSALERKVTEYDKYKASQTKKIESLVHQQKLHQNQQMELAKLTKDSSQKDSEILKLKADCSKKDSDIKSLYEKCLSKIAEVESIEEKCAKYDKLRDLAVTESLKINSDLAKMKDSHAKKETEFKNLQEEASKEFQIKLRENREKISDLERQVAERDSEIKVLKDKQIAIKEAVQKHEEAIYSENCAVEDVKEEIRGLKKKVQNSSREKQKISDQLRETNIEMQKVGQHRDNLQVENEQLKADIGEKESKIESLIEQTFDKEIEIKCLLEQGIDKESTIEGLRKESAGKDEEIKKLHENYEDRENLLKELEDTYTSKENLIKSMVDKEMKDLRSELKKRNERINKLTNKSKINVKEIKDLKKHSSKKDEEVKKLKSSNLEKEEKLTEISKEIARKDENLKSLHSQFIEIDEDIKRFRREYEEKDGSLRELEEKARKSDNELDSMRIKINEKDSELQEMKLKFEVLEENVKKMREIKKSQDGQLSKLMNSENKSKASISVLEKQLGRKERRVEELQNLQIKKEKEAKNLREQNKEFEKETEKMKHTQNSLLTSIEELNSIVKDHKDELVGLQTSLKERTDETVELKERLDILKNTTVSNLDSSTQTEEGDNFEIMAKELHTELIKVKDELLEMNNKNRKLRKEHQILKSLNEFKNDT